MVFLRTPEIKQSLLLHLIGILAFSAVGCIFSLPVGLFVLVLCLVFTDLHFFSYWRVCRDIRRLSSDLDRVLHGAGQLHFSDYREGELAILKNEIDKMLIRLREQSEALKQDKIYLADAMADISHQIRTPLTSIHLVISLLSEPELSETKRQELVRQLSMLISRIDWLIEALLKLSRLDAGTVTLKPEQILVKNLISAAAEPLEIPLELRGLVLSVDVGEESLFVDFIWTVEALSNLLKNCMEHTERGGIHVFVSENAIYTELIIEDDGPGFAPEELPRLFERFYKGTNSGQQSIGIGLALSRSILTGQNATMKAENRPEGGARFIIHFYKEMLPK